MNTAKKHQQSAAVAASAFGSSKLERVVALFNDEFLAERTCLLPGADEPFYQAFSSQEPSSFSQSSKFSQSLNSKDANGISHLDGFARIYSREDYVSSALHEVAHWCLAGEKRRQKDDYGYWYAPDGRTVEQQREFYHVEVKPQAVERAFAIACGHEFSVSLDNLDYVAQYPEQAAQDLIDFRQAIEQKFSAYCQDGFPVRAERFLARLHAEFSTDKVCQQDRKAYSNNQVVGIE